jgi:AmmeMemoRadiSam system protein B/AmmeMemoRadiSam system protein A
VRAGAVVSLLLLAAVNLCAQDRPAAVAGAFYPAEPAALGQLVDEMLTHSPVSYPRERPLGLICPHAGYVYSGMVAAAGYKQLAGQQYATVVVVSPSHREYFEHSAVLCSGSYSTPLGRMEIDSALAAGIAGAGLGTVQCSPRGHIQPGAQMGEHALEVHLPFLQRALGSFKLVPIVMGSQREENCEELAKALAGALKGRSDILLVASSDLSHYHSYEQANELDSRVASLVGKFDNAGLLAAVNQGNLEACGAGPMTAVMSACRLLGADSIRVLERANSGDVTSDKSRVVGYLSAMIFDSRQIKNGNTQNSTRDDKMQLTADDKAFLLKVARETIEKAVRGETVPTFEPISAVTAEYRGAFVTIRKHGKLRGCIGLIEGMKPLVETVREMAVAAALRDMRFDPVTEKELGEIDLEISAMSPIQRVADPAQIVAGRDGLIVRRGGMQGLLLPQVATEYGWDRETFLAQTCRKAGLPLDAWKMPGTEISFFSAEVFGEQER